MKRLFFAFVFLIAVLNINGNSHAEKKIKIAGSGGMINLVTDLAKAYMSENKNVVVEVNQKSIESTGGIMSVAGGAIDIGMSARYLKEEEKALGLRAFEIARVATVIGTNKDVKITDISSESICKIYKGEVKEWYELGSDTGEIIPLTRPERDATKEVVRRGIKCFKDVKEPNSIIIIPTAPEMAKVLSSRPGTIGFTDLIAVKDSKGSIKVLSLDGVAPTPENIQSGKYKLIKPFCLVTKGEPSGDIKSFIDFVKGPKGAKIIETNKAVAVR